MLDPNSFLISYQSTDRALVIKNTLNQRIKGFNVCKYVSCNIEDNYVWILLEGEEKIELVFSNSNDANIGGEKIREAINILSPNCSIGGVPPSPDPIPTPISITLSLYKTLVTNSTVVPLQWYDINDVNNTLSLGTGQVYRVQALNVNDSSPRGIVLGIGSYYNREVVLNLTVSSINFFNDTRGLLYGIFSSSIETTSSSRINAINSSIRGSGNTFINAFNSGLTLYNCTKISCFSSTITLHDSSSCIFENITANLTGYSFDSIFVNKSTSIGKIGRVDYDVTDSTTYELVSYVDVVNTFLIGTLQGDTIITLTNPISQANAKFSIYAEDSLDLNGYKIDIISGGNTIFTFTESLKGSLVDFDYDKTGGIFYTLGKSAFKFLKTNITVSTDGQSSFPNLLSLTPENISSTMLYVNGIKQKYGDDYSITNTSLTWLSSDFDLEITDSIEIFYW